MSSVSTKAERIMASASSDISSGSAFVDTFVKRNLSSRSFPREYLYIRSVSKTVSQFISRNSLSFKLDDKTVEKVRTFRDENMKSSSCGTGLTLTAATEIIFLELNWQRGLMNQAIDRCHRIGQTKPVGITKIVCEDSLDQWVMRSENGKKKMQTLLLAALRKLSNESKS